MSCSALAFGHGLEALIKFGDEVNIEARREQVGRDADHLYELN